MSKGLKLYKKKLMGHSDAVCDLFSFAGEMGGLLVSISCDGHLRVWDLVSEKFEKKFLRRFPDEFDEEGTVKRLHTMDFIDHAGFTEKIIYCTYPDGTIYAWNMKSGELVYTFQGHDDKITAIIIINSTTFATCSYDHTVGNLTPHSYEILKKFVSNLGFPERMLDARFQIWESSETHGAKQKLPISIDRQ